MREDKLSQEIKKQISKILTELFPTIFASVVRVTFTEGVKTAHVFISIYDANKMKLYREIDKGKAKIREMLSKKLKIRRVPSLILRLDDTIEYGQHMSNVINNLKEGE